MSLGFEDGVRFGFLIHDVSRLRRVAVDRRLRPLGITRSQWWLLSFLSRRDGMTQTALAADLDLSKVAIGGLLGRMEAAGLVQRRPDALDARIRRVYLTRAGNRLVGQIRDQIEGFEMDILRYSTEEEYEISLRMLRRTKEALIQMLGADGEEPPLDEGALIDEEETVA